MRLNFDRIGASPMARAGFLPSRWRDRPNSSAPTYWRHSRPLGCGRWISTRTGRDGQWRHHCSRQADARRCARRARERTTPAAKPPCAPHVSGDGAAAHRCRQRSRTSEIHPADRMPRSKTSGIGRHAFADIGVTGLNAFQKALQAGLTECSRRISARWRRTVPMA